MEPVDQPRRMRVRRPGGRVAISARVRPEVKATLEKGALDADITLASYVADIVAEYVGMEP